MCTSSPIEIIRLTSQVRYRAVGDDGVVVHLKNGRVIVVNAVGLFIIQQLSSPIDRLELADRIANAFEVSRQEAREDLEVYLSSLLNEQIITVQSL